MMTEFRHKSCSRAVDQNCRRNYAFSSAARRSLSVFHLWFSRRVSLLALTLLALTLLPGAAAYCSADETWIEDSFEDFIDGRLDAAGQNLYVSSDGAVRTIHRFDLNQDGFIDLAFNSTHDTFTTIPATVAVVSGADQVSTDTLPVQGSRDVAAADLNQDGFTDLVFCQNRSGAQQGRNSLTIFWGTAGGWSVRRSTRGLPVHDARRIAVADLNADTWPDLVILNKAAWQLGQPDGDIVRVYWGGADGFLLPRVTDTGVAGAVDLVADDFDGDGARDLVVSAAGSGLHVFWAAPSHEPAADLHPVITTVPGPVTCITSADVDADTRPDLVLGTDENRLMIVMSRTERSWGAPESVTAPGAGQISAGDLDRDGFVDIVVTKLSAGRAGGGEPGATIAASARFPSVLWGSAGGYSGAATTELPVLHAAATAMGDLNADGIPDLAVAVYQGADLFATDSVILFGSGEREFTNSRQEIPTTGATAAVIVLPQPDLPAQAVFCSSVGGSVREEVPLQIYWGEAEGFSAGNVLEIPFTSGYESSAADLNGDGAVDLVELNSAHGGADPAADPTMGINLFWGGKQGFGVHNRTILREENVGTSNIADLNRDGYLDLVPGQFSPAKGAGETQVIVYFGSKAGFRPENRQAIPSAGRSLGSVVADFDGDHWLDIAVTSFLEDRVRIFRGGPAGFAAERQFSLRVHSAIDMDTADLNRDGHQDLIVGSYADGKTHEHDLGTTIFWGSDTGFSHAGAQWLPGFTPIGHCVADFDADGYLDLFSPHYHANGTRESLPCFLFWGSADGFLLNRRTSLICDSAHDAQAADYDHDGRLDLAVVCHATDDTHHTVSKIFFNDGRRFQEPRMQTLPTHGPHWMWHGDMGHIADRSWKQVYESSVLALQEESGSGETGMVGSVFVLADVPNGATLVLMVRSAPRAGDLPAEAWQPISDSDFQIGSLDRFLQYAAVFRSDNGDRFPVLHQVTISLRKKTG